MDDDDSSVYEPTQTVSNMDRSGTASDASHSNSLTSLLAASDEESEEDGDRTPAAGHTAEG